ncbi:MULTISPECIES: hypothetical protein [Paraburkholderia]|jgi:hypothetical protein|uniref:hypothetical protein n=1 Tax=Paraburkholderia TaxID=1822464 RepID=UPI001CAD314C|nr:hypothetical protein [Paraburkholderia caribensis]GJH33506.1 hypothetical protein CBA19CS91_12135 [Paraburkholderia hospita]CAG9271803.1 exported hypothetical protein [Paraburkholderia caribensis]
MKVKLAAFVLFAISTLLFTTQPARAGEGGGGWDVCYDWDGDGIPDQCYWQSPYG